MFLQNVFTTRSFLGNATMPCFTWFGIVHTGGTPRGSTLVGMETISNFLGLGAPYFDVVHVFPWSSILRFVEEVARCGFVTIGQPKGTFEPALVSSLRGISLQPGQAVTGAFMLCVVRGGEEWKLAPCIGTWAIKCCF